MGMLLHRHFERDEDLPRSAPEKQPEQTQTTKPSETAPKKRGRKAKED